jgi:two-component system NtrC family sensor kinase
MTTSDYKPNSTNDGRSGNLGPTDEHLANEQIHAAQEALIHRPRISIRLRITLGFLVTFIFICGITIAAMIFINNITNKQQLLEKAGNLEFEIQQARRFEKNWFLYGTNLYDALNNVQNAQNILRSFEDEMRRTIGNHAYENMSYNLTRYKETLEELDALSVAEDSTLAGRRPFLESELRHFGAEIVSSASNTIDQERLRIHTWLKTSMVVAVAALVVFLIFIALISAFITQQIIRPFGRFESYTRRIAAGDFTLIAPARKYRDEFTNLASALNNMLMELKRREGQLIDTRKMAAIGNLTAGIAHELNNPLNNISLTTESLIDEFDEWNREEKLKMLNVIFSQVERASTTVANLLDFTRRDEDSFEEISINGVVDSTLKLVSNEINLNNITLDVHLHDNLPRIKGNAHNLQQVFLNLFLNATQAMPDGGKLSIVSYVEDSSIRIDISDTGVGISEENMDKVFEPFFTTKEVGRGTGLGLSVSYGIIKRHRGTIAVESKLGKGTKFSITLPATDGATATSSKESN